MTRELRAPLMAMALCAAVFVGCFAIGRAERPKSSTGGGLWSSRPTASAGASIPLALGGAPPIDRRAITVINRSVPKRSAGAATKSPFAQAAVTSGTSGTLSAPTSTQPAPAPEVVTPVSSSERRPATTAPNAGAGPTRHAPATKTESGASHSFDSSD